MEYILSAYLKDHITFGFFNVIFSLFIMGAFAGLVYRYGPQESRSRLARFIIFLPSAITTIGVIGTFFGIFVGLAEFDVENIDASVPRLLVGLKIAFATSLCGMATALLFKSSEHIGRILLGSPEVTMDDDPAFVLNEIKNAIRNQTSALISENERSIASIMNRTRQDIQDGFKDQKNAFDDFAEKMKEGATEKIVDALKQAIVGFNQNITEQFGDNFKQLNEAVGRLNEWQQEYKSHVEQVETAIVSQAESLKSVLNDLSTVTEEAKSFSDAAASMKEANSSILRNFEAMSDLLKSLGQIKSDAETVLPMIQKNIHDTSATMKSASENMEETMRQTLERSQKGIEANFEKFEQEVGTQLGKILENMGTQLTSLSAKFVEDYTPLTEQLQRLVREAGQVRQ